MTERRFCDTRASKRAGQIVGYAAVFYDPDEPGTEYDLGGFRERIRPGAFADAIQRDDIRALFNHSPDHILGRNKAGTLELSEDSYGLRYVITPPDTQTGRDVLTSVERGDITGSSFGFEILGDTWTREAGTEIRWLERLKVWDVGPVSFPAYSSTTVDARAIRAHWDAQRAKNHAEYLALFPGGVDT